MGFTHCGWLMLLDSYVLSIGFFFFVHSLPIAMAFLFLPPLNLFRNSGGPCCRVQFYGFSYPVMVTLSIFLRSNLFPVYFYFYANI